MNDMNNLQDSPYGPPPQYSPPGQPAPNLNYGISQAQKNSTAPPLPGFLTNQSQPQQQTTVQQTPPLVIYANPTVTQVQFGPYPMRFTCPNCNAHVMTETHSVPGLLTYILSGALCFLAWYLLCCLVPCCVRECKDIEHRCPNCKHCLGLFKRI